MDVASRESFLPDFCTKRLLILGCGNRLFGDDGFGPAVIDRLTAERLIPEDAYVMDVGTGVRKLLFTLCLSGELPERIVFVDAVDKGRTPGEVFEIELDELPLEKTDDFSLHQAPTSNLAKELASKGVQIRVVACQVSRIPETMEVGLSAPVAAGIAKASAMIAGDYSFGMKPLAQNVQC